MAQNWRNVEDLSKEDIEALENEFGYKYKIFFNKLKNQFAVQEIEIQVCSLCANEIKKLWTFAEHHHMSGSVITHDTYEEAKKARIGKMVYDKDYYSQLYGEWEEYLPK